MLDMVLLVASRNVATTEGGTAIGTDEVQTAKVIFLTKWLLFPFGAVDGKKLRCNDISTIQALEAIKVENGTECTHECTLHRVPTGGTWR